MIYHPPVDFAYLRAITDCTGVYQHGVHSVPNRRLGYTTDDNARALVVATQQYERTGDRADLDLAVQYLSYIHYAATPEHRFQNVMSFQREFLDEDGTEDCHGRVMWACGRAAGSKLPENVRIVARKLFDDSIAWIGDMGSPRAQAYGILGMYEYLKANSNTLDLGSRIDALGAALASGFDEYSDSEWKWYEPYLTYGNAILPVGMLIAAEVTNRKHYKEVASQTIQFLTDTLLIDGRMEIIGNDGWYLRGKKRAWYDQQSIDAGYTVFLYAFAHQLTGDRQYLEMAKTAYSWFFGNNRSGVWVYDKELKACYDAVTPWGLNLNQGSESIICFLLAQLAMEELGMAGVEIPSEV